MRDLTDDIQPTQYNGFCTNCAEKDQKIKELEKENKSKSELGLALYTSLAKELESQGMTDNIPSAIDQLVGKGCGVYADMYCEYKNLQRKNKELEILLDNEQDTQTMMQQEIDSLQDELEIYKKALELSCENLEENDKAYLIKSKQKSKENHKKHFLQQAKEEIENDKEK